MKNIFILLILSYSLSALAATTVSLGDLQGAWWSDERNPTADFAIQGEMVWLDSDAQYHPCKVEGGTLVFDLGEGLGDVRHRIVSLNGDELVLESSESQQRVILKRERP